MKKWFGLVVMVVLMLSLLAGCGCEHEWAEADCDSPKTCNLCGETEGAPLGHSWLAATCAKAKHCEICGTVEGTALEHTWQEATCTAPKTCSVCAATEGEALGHTWTDATCTEPKTCSVCAATEGEALGHVYSDEINCEEAKTCGVCGYSDGVIPGHTWVDATTEAPKTCTTCGVTEGEPLKAVSDLGVSYDDFMDTLEAALDLYALELEYTYTEDDGTIWYTVISDTDSSLDIEVYFELAADGDTVAEFGAYTASGLEGRNAYWTGVIAGCGMVIADNTLTSDDLTSLTSEIDFSEDGIDYYTLEKNGLGHAMAVNETTGQIIFFIVPTE